MLSDLESYLRQDDQCFCAGDNFGFLKAYSMEDSVLWKLKQNPDTSSKCLMDMCAQMQTLTVSSTDADDLNGDVFDSSDEDTDSNGTSEQFITELNTVRNGHSKVTNVKTNDLINNNDIYTAKLSALVDVLNSEEYKRRGSRRSDDFRPRSRSLPSPGHAQARRRRVSFADECGHSLVTVKSFCSDDDNMITRSNSWPGRKVANTAITLKAIYNFKQPASEYLAFRQKIKNHMVSLENVFLQKWTLCGTVKVKNISYEKDIIVRMTCNNWKTHRDLLAEFVPNGYSAGNEFDTFMFKLNITDELVHCTVQLSVCFRVNSEQFWDNNGGLNYQVKFKQREYEAEVIRSNRASFSDLVQSGNSHHLSYLNY